MEVTLCYLLSETLDKKSVSGITQRKCVRVSGCLRVYLYQITSHLLSLEIDGD